MPLFFVFVSVLILALLQCVYLSEVLTCIFLMTNDIEHLSMCLLAIWMPSLVKCLLSLLYICKLWCVRVFLIDLHKLYMYSRHESFVKYMHCEYFSHGPWFTSSSS